MEIAGPLKNEEHNVYEIRIGDEKVVERSDPFADAKPVKLLNETRHAFTVS